MSHFLALYPVLMSLGMGSGLVGLLYFILNFAVGKIKERLCCSVVIKFDDDTFEWVNKYMQDKGHIRDDTVLKASIKKKEGPWWQEIFKTKDEKKKPEVEYAPGRGTHCFNFKGRTLWVSHIVGKTLTVGHEKKPMEMESIEISVFGKDSSIIKEFIDCCVEHCRVKDEGLVGIYELHRWGLGWTKV